jgi:ABC-type uncharacterized transport system permease subunit
MTRGSQPAVHVSDRREMPVALAATVPAEALTGSPSIDTLTIAAGFVPILLLLTRWFFPFGLCRYSGALS